jgi:hypothetical protein
MGASRAVDALISHAPNAAVTPSPAAARNVRRDNVCSAMLSSLLFHPAVATAIWKLSAQASAKFPRR